ncbi:hypothetical protein Tco_0717169 [Tanacetum coccineum]
MTITLLNITANTSEQGHHHQRLKTPIDMLGFFGWLASIKQGMLEPVKVKCIFLGYRKGEYTNLSLGSGVVRVQGDEFEVEPHGNVDHVVGSQEVQTQDLIYYHPARDREQHSWRRYYAHGIYFSTIHAYEVIFQVEAGVGKMTMDASVNCITKGLLVKAKGNILGLKIIGDSSGNTLRVSQSRFHNEKLVQNLLKGHSILSLEVGSQEYQMVCTRLDIASADVGILDKFDRGLQTDVQVFVDFDYAMGRSITRGLEEGNKLKGLGRVRI